MISWWPFWGSLGLQASINGGEEKNQMKKNKRWEGGKVKLEKGEGEVNRKKGGK